MKLDPFLAFSIFSLSLCLSLFQRLITQISSAIQEHVVKQAGIVPQSAV